MIPADADIQIQRLDPSSLVILDADHALPLEPWAVEHYARLLTDRPDADTDPLLVVEDAQGRRRVRRGRHRLLANLRVGRRAVWAMVYREAAS